MARTSRDDDAVRITTAGSDRAADIAARQKRYLISMSLRSLCFVGAGISALAGIGWLWPILIAGALVLPYIAVVLANAATTRSDAFELQQPLSQRPQLTAGTGPADQTVGDTVGETVGDRDTHDASSRG